MSLKLVVALLCLAGVSSGFQNDPMCGQKSASYPDNIVVRDGKIQGERAGIVGGGEAKSHSWPWQVAMAMNGKGSCGGTVISNNWVMTAAHCVDGVDPSNIAIGFGMHGSDYFQLLSKAPNDAGAKVCTGTEIIEHEEWDKIKAKKTDYDIALVKFDCDLQWTDTIRPACLPSAADSFYTKGEKAVLTGWGRVGSGETRTDKLKQLLTEIVGQHEPNWQVGGQVAVAGDQFGTCVGDSGGPMHVMRAGKWYVAGVVSTGSAGSDGKYCDSVDGTSNYTHVPSFMDWINSKIR